MYFPPRKTFLLVSFLQGFVYFLFDEVAVVDLLVLLLLPPCTTLLLWYTSKCTAVAAAAATLPQSAAAYIGALFAAPVASWHRICCCTPLAPSPRHHTCTLSHLQIQITSTDLFTCRLSYLQNNSTFTAAPHNINIIFRTTATCAHYHTYTIVHLNFTADIIFDGFVLLHAWKIASQVFLDEVHDIQERKIAWDQIKSRWKGNKRRPPKNWHRIGRERAT